MEIVSLIVGIVDKYAVEPAIRQVGYLTHCKSKLEKLPTQVNELSEAGERLKREVVRAEKIGETIHTDVQNWLDEVVEITEKESELWKPDTQAKMSCLCGVCPNPVHRYKLGRESTKLEKAVVKLYAKRDFASISHNVHPQDVSVVSDKHYEAFDSRTSTVKEIMDELRIPNTDLILVYGIGGVGKTTLVEDVLRRGEDHTGCTTQVVKIFNNSSISMSNTMPNLHISLLRRNLVQLQRLEITHCKSMEEIVSTKEYGEEKTDGMFCKLQHLHLEYLPKLSRFCSASCYVQFPSLESLTLRSCKELKGFVFDPKPETEEVYFLFDDKLGFPKLEKLSIDGLSILTTIWHNQLDPDSFYKLRDVEVSSCDCLINIFPCSVARGL